MSETEGQKEMVKADRPQPMSVDQTGMFVTRNSQELWRVAKMLLATGAAPKSYREPEQVVVAIQALKSMGLNPYVSLRQTGMINGSFTVWGDLPLALVRAGGELEWIEEFMFTLSDGHYVRQCFDNGNCHEAPYGAVCRVKRLNHPVHESVFTLHQAKQANLLGKPGPWTQYTDRMLRYRARSGALKDIFSDGLQGVAIREYDIEGVDGKDFSSASDRPKYSQVSPAQPDAKVMLLRKLEKVKAAKAQRAKDTKREEVIDVSVAQDIGHDDGEDMPTSSVPEPENIIDPNADVSSPYASETEAMSEREALEAAMVAMRGKVSSETHHDAQKKEVG